MNPFPLASAMMRHNLGTCAAFVLLIALAVGLGAAITAQERALKRGSARAADKFDLIVGAPGSQTDLMLKVVFLQPGTVELLEGEPLRRLMGETRAAFVAPIGFGDSYKGDPVVGTIAALVDHLAVGQLEGRTFASRTEAVVGAGSPLFIGSTFEASHGHGPEAEGGSYHPQDISVVGRLPPTGSPWDRAILVPIELTWDVHGLGTGHKELTPVPIADAPFVGIDERSAAETIGPPFDLDIMPGVPAVLLKPGSVPAAYGLRSAWRTSETMAFFPAEVLVQLYELLGDVRVVMSALALATQALLIAAILSGILILMRLYRQRFAVMRALGAPRHFIFGVVWTFGFALVGAGSLIGLGVAALLSAGVSEVFERSTGIALQAQIAEPELILAATITVIGAFLATVPALLLYREPVIRSLRGM